MSVRSSVSLATIVLAGFTGCDADPLALESRELAALVSTPGFTVEPNQSMAGLRFVASASDVNVDATATGALKGTPAHVAPEVWRGACAPPCAPAARRGPGPNGIRGRCAWAWAWGAS